MIQVEKALSPNSLSQTCNSYWSLTPNHKGIGLTTSSDMLFTQTVRLIVKYLSAAEQN